MRLWSKLDYWPELHASTSSEIGNYQHPVLYPISTSFELCRLGGSLNINNSQTVVMQISGHLFNNIHTPPAQKLTSGYLVISSPHWNGKRVDPS